MQTESNHYAAAMLEKIKSAIEDRKKEGVIKEMTMNPIDVEILYNYLPLISRHEISPALHYKDVTEICGIRLAISKTVKDKTINISIEN